MRRGGLRDTFQKEGLPNPDPNPDPNSNPNLNPTLTLTLLERYLPEGWLGPELRRDVVVVGDRVSLDRMPDRAHHTEGPLYHAACPLWSAMMFIMLLASPQTRCAVPSCPRGTRTIQHHSRFIT